MINPVLYLANRNGIPRIKSTGLSVNGTTNVQISFNSDASFSSNYSGLILVKIEQSMPTGADTLPIVFTSAAGSQPVTLYGGSAMTGSDFPGTGIYLMYYDRSAGTLQLLLT